MLEPVASGADLAFKITVWALISPDDLASESGWPARLLNGRGRFSGSAQRRRAMSKARQAQQVSDEPQKRPNISFNRSLIHRVEC
jgi:hypothetical protein